jgi:hypothetical protein
MLDEQAQGWFRDPYGIHGHRWFSQGQPTYLVRDGHVVSRASPPPGEVPTPLVPAEEEPPDRRDARRADAATRKDQSYDARAAFFAVMDRTLGQGPIG